MKSYEVSRNDFRENILRIGFLKPLERGGQDGKKERSFSTSEQERDVPSEVHGNGQKPYVMVSLIKRRIDLDWTLSWLDPVPFSSF